MHTGKLVKANLDLERSIALLLVDLKILITDKGDLLIRSLSTQHIAERHVLETLGLTNVIVVGAVDRKRLMSCHNTQIKNLHVDTSRDTGAFIFVNIINRTYTNYTTHQQMS